MPACQWLDETTFWRPISLHRTSLRPTCLHQTELLQSVPRPVFRKTAFCRRLEVRSFAVLKVAELRDVARKPGEIPRPHQAVAIVRGWRNLRDHAVVPDHAEGLVRELALVRAEELVPHHARCLGMPRVSGLPGDQGPSRGSVHDRRSAIVPDQVRSGDVHGPELFRGSQETCELQRPHDLAVAHELELDQNPVPMDQHSVFD